MTFCPSDVTEEQYATIVSSAMYDVYLCYFLYVSASTVNAQLVEEDKTGSEGQGSYSSFAKTLFRVAADHRIYHDRPIISRFESGPVQKSREPFLLCCFENHKAS